jgi:outer membrane protein assembly factor BamD (BamD/ComL family)
LREEIRLLDSARNAIQTHRPEEAFVSLNAYANRFAAGAFKQEASVLRMQALAQRGDVGQASSMAKQFVQSNPNSPYVGRAARIARNSNPSGPGR